MEVLAIALMFTISAVLGIAGGRLTLSAVFYSMARATSTTRTANRNR